MYFFLRQVSCPGSKSLWSWGYPWTSDPTARYHLLSVGLIRVCHQAWSLNQKGKKKQQHVFPPHGWKGMGKKEKSAEEMWAQPPPSLLYSGNAGDGSPAAAARAWLSRWFVASLELGTPWGHATNVRTKTHVCPFFWNQDMMFSTKHMVQNYVTQLFKKNCQSLIFHIASHLCRSAMGFMHGFHWVQKLQPCLSLSHRSSKSALCPAHRFQMMEKPVQQQECRWGRGARAMEGKRKERRSEKRKE